MKGILTLKKSAVIAAVYLVVLCISGYSEPTPEQIAERTKLLYEAVKNDDLEWVKLCIKHGAYVNARVGNGTTVLMHAISRDVADVLIRSGADVNAKSNGGYTALMYQVLPDNDKTIASRADIAELLIKSGADVNAKANSGWTALRGVKSGGGVSKYR